MEKGIDPRLNELEARVEILETLLLHYLGSEKRSPESAANVAFAAVSKAGNDKKATPTLRRAIEDLNARAKPIMGWL